MNADSNENVDFGFLDRDQEIEISQGKLPHWFQPGTAQFITFRTHDSMPKDVVAKWRGEIRAWLTANNLDPELIDDSKNNKQIQSVFDRIESLNPKLKTQFRKLRIGLWMNRLDECHGECVLRRPGIAKIVADSILHFEGDRYDLDCFVVMPNHVHAIVQFKNGYDQSLVTQSWTRFSAREINKVLGRCGQFWQSEPFDHVIRNDNQFAYLQKYIKDNPTKSNLQSGEFIYWTRE